MFEEIHVPNLIQTVYLLCMYINIKLTHDLLKIYFNFVYMSVFLFAYM